MPPSPTHRLMRDGLDDQLLQLSPLEFARALEVPTLIRVPGDGDSAPRGVACLLHGDESTGLEAVLQVLQRRRRWPFDLWVLIGNVQAAVADGGFQRRYLPNQEDFNRVWGLNGNSPDTPQRDAANAVLETLAPVGLSAMVDIHNNTGDNPFYAIVTTNEPGDYNVATLFTTTILRWNLLVNTLMEGLSRETTAIAVECGLPGLLESRAFAVDGLRRYLGVRRFRDDYVRFDVDVYGDMAKVRVPADVSFAFGGDLRGHDFVVADGADRHNFRRIPEGHVIGRVQPGHTVPLVVEGPHGRNVTAEHLAVTDGGLVVTRHTTIPVMMTRTVDAARKDVLFYMADQLPPPGVAGMGFPQPDLDQA